MSSKVGSLSVPAGFSLPRSPITSLALAHLLTYSHYSICLLFVSQCKLLYLPLLTPPEVSQDETFISKLSLEQKPDDSLKKIPALRTQATWALLSPEHQGCTAAGQQQDLKKILQSNGLRTFLSWHSERTGGVWFAKGQMCFLFSEQDTGISKRTSLKWFS